VSLELPRADDLRLISGMCAHLAACKNHCATIASLNSWIVALVRTQRKREWRRTRVYHYTAAATELGLITKLGQHEVELTQHGHELSATHREAHMLGEPLTPAEIRLFRRRFLDTPSVGRYLAFFMPNGNAPRSWRELRSLGKPVRISRAECGVFKLTTASKTDVLLTRVEKRSYAWTLFNWLRDVALLDDIYDEEPESFFANEPEVRIFYPIRRRHLTAHYLRELLTLTAGQSMARVRWLFIPQLLATIGANYGIPKSIFFKALLAAHEENPLEFHLEMTSAVRTDSRCLANHDYSNYPVVCGVPRSHVRLVLNRGVKTL
jgi:hypothetical protein